MTPDDFPYRTSFWIEQEPERAPRLEGTERADVAVVGGGYAGLSTVRHLKAADPSLDVALLESEFVGFGASGRNAGGLSSLPPLGWFFANVRNPRSLEEARWVISYLRREQHEFTELIEREGIDCDLVPQSVVITSTRSLSWNMVKAMVERVRIMGVPARLLSEAERREVIRFPAKGAAVVDGGFTMHPYKLARGLLDFALRQGVRLYENTRVSSVQPLSSGVELLTETGARMLARKVVVATNAYTPTLRLGQRRLQGRIYPMPVHTHMLATEPLDEATQDRLGFADPWRHAYLVDVSGYVGGHLYGGRLTVNGGGENWMSGCDVVADQRPKSYRRLHATLLDRFPLLADTRIEAAWAGAYHFLPTQLPRVRALAEAPDVVLNVGYSGDGVSITQFSGKMVTGLVLGGKHMDPDAERARRLYESTKLPLRQGLMWGVEALRGCVRAGAGHESV